MCEITIHAVATSDRPIRISVSVFTDIIGIFHVSVSDRICIFLTDFFSDVNETIFCACISQCAHKVLPPTTKNFKNRHFNIAHTDGTRPRKTYISSYAYAFLSIKYDHIRIRICIGVSVSELHLYRIGSVQIISVSDRIGIFSHRSITILSHAE